MSAQNLENTDRVVDPAGGTNQVRGRAFNERLVLSLIRRHGSLPKSEIARRSGLTAQTVSIIMRSLEKDGLILRGQPQKGKVGQPSIPMSLNPNGAYSIGLKVGRRSADLILIDFLGQVLNEFKLTYDYPTPDTILNFSKKGIHRLQSRLRPEQRNRITGIGIAKPFELWNWAEKIDAPEREMLAWRDFSFQEELSSFVNYQVFEQNDATSACGAELVFGRGAELSDFAYFFIGTFIGGGIVLNHSVYSGRTGYAGAFGPMPVAFGQISDATLIDYTSILGLENALQKRNLHLPGPNMPAEHWFELGEVLNRWMNVATTYLANAILASCSVVDFQAVVIDGAFPKAVRCQIVENIQLKIGKMDTRGLQLPKILEGTVGHNARALGGASQPLLSKFLMNQSVLFKEMA